MLLSTPKNVKEFIVLAQVLNSGDSLEFTAVRAKELVENGLLESSEDFKAKLEELTSNY